MLFLPPPPLLLLLCLVTLASSDTTTTSPLDGTWQLDIKRDVGSMEQLLATMGVGYFTRRVVSTLDMTDRYTVNRTEFRIVRHTKYSDSDQRYSVDTPEEVQDPMLGTVRSLVHVNEDLSRVLMTMIRPGDQAIFTGLRHVSVRGDPRLIIHTMNFTLPSGQHASCVRHFVKQ